MRTTLGPCTTRALPPPLAARGPEGTPGIEEESRLSTSGTRVLAIVVNYEGASRTVRCVRSLARISHPGLEIVVVDNASADDSVAHLRRELPGIRVFERERNGGYAAALNVGIRHGLDAGATHLWLLNNDLLVAPDALDEALRVWADVPRAGLIASAQIAAGPTRSDRCGGR